MSKNKMNYIEKAEQRDIETTMKIVDYGYNQCIRYYYETDNNDVSYRGINLVDFEKACLISRLAVLDEFKKEKPVDYEDAVGRFVMTLEFELFNGLYMGDLEDLIEESDKVMSQEGGDGIC